MYITNIERPDGFGAQFQGILWAILYAECNGHTFVYSDIKEMAHNYDNQPNFVQELEDFMGIKKHYPSLSTIGDAPIQRYRSDEYYKEIEKNIAYYHATPAFQKIKQAFYDGKQNPFSPEFSHVAVHVRRSNAHDDRLTGVTTPNQYYLMCMNVVRQSPHPKPLKFHIYSQGEEKNFSDFIAPDVEIHLNGSIQETFLGMVFADVLITSGSSFSYVAGLLTNGNVIYKNFWHPPLPSWHTVMTPYREW